MKKLIILLLIIAGVGFIIYGLEAPEDTPEEDQEITNREVEFVAAEDEEAQEVKVIEEESEEEVFSVTIDEVNEWSEDNWDHFEETPQVGPNDMQPGEFSFFDREASISPDNTKLVFSVSGYASLSTTSLVIVADLEEDKMNFVGEPARGTVEEFVWSDDSTKLAYTLGTARAQGDYLRVDNVENKEKLFRLSEEEILSIIDPDEEMVEAGQFMPVFRDLSWTDEGLEFKTDHPEDEEDLWIVDENGDLEERN
ncbi:MAG: hypothetical protein ACQEP3_00525 [Patescibacteria group bacterium]